MPNRPSDAELAKLLRDALDNKEGYKSRAMQDFEIATVARRVADALNAAPARLTPEQWAKAVERARNGYEAHTREKTMIGVVLDADAVSYALWAAFPRLAPIPDA